MLVLMLRLALLLVLKLSQEAPCHLRHRELALPWVHHVQATEPILPLEVHGVLVHGPYSHWRRLVQSVVEVQGVLVHGRYSHWKWLVQLVVAHGEGSWMPHSRAEHFLLDKQHFHNHCWVHSTTSVLRC